MQTGFEYVANQESVEALSLCFEAAFEHFDRVLEFEIAILVGDGPMRTEATDLNRNPRRRRRFDNSLEDTAVGSVTGSPRNPEALVDEAHGQPLPWC